MAEVVTSLPEGSPGRPRVSKYDTYMDGRAWKLDIGTDILGNQNGARQALMARARAVGKKVRTRLSKCGKHIYVQAYVPE